MEPEATKTDNGKKVQERSQGERPKAAAGAEREQRKAWPLAAATVGASGAALILSSLFGIGEAALACAAGYFAFKAIVSGREQEAVTR